MPSFTSKANFCLSFLGVTLPTSSILSKFSTVRRLAHAEITESESFEAVFVFCDVAVDFLVIFGFFIAFDFLFLDFESSSSDSTLRGIA